MREILPGVWHWTAEHPRIHQPVSSYYLEDAGAVLDPMLPEGGVEAFGDRAVQQVILSNRLHTRDTAAVHRERGATVRVPRAGLAHFDAADFAVEPYEPGDEIAPGVRCHDLGAICPDDMVLHVHAGLGALHFADGLITHEGALAFVPDVLMDEPEAVKARTLDRLEELLELDFDALTFAHGEPIAEGGRDTLAAFVRRARS
jgi:hypothetical protein